MPYQKPRWMTKDIEIFLKATLKLRNKEEVQNFFMDVMTIPELKIISARLKVAQMLDQGVPYTEIERSTGMSSATIAKISKNLNYGSGGYNVIINRLKNSR